MLIVLLIAQAGYEEMSLEELMNIRVEAVSRYEEGVRETPASVTVITQKEMHDLGLRSLADVLDYAMSTLVTFDREYNRASFRGFVFLEDWNSRILVLVDGHILNEVWDAYAPTGEDLPIPFEMVERIEIMRGPGSSIYGTNALIGVINIVTQREGFALSVGGMMPEAGGEARATAGWSNGSLRFWAGGSMADERYPDLEIPEQSVEYEAGYGGDSVYGGIARDVDYSKRYYALVGMGWGDLELSLSAFRRISGLPYADYNAVYGEKRNNISDSHEYIDLSYSHGFGPWTISIQGYWDHYRYIDNFFFADWDSSDYPVDSGYNWRTLGDPFWWGGDIRVRYAGSGLGFLAGTAYQHRKTYQDCWVENMRGDTIDKMGILYPVILQDVISPYGELSFISGFGRITAGVRYDRYSDYGGIIAPRVGGVAVLPAGAALKLVYGKSFRAPAAYEIYYIDGEDVIANPNLVAEKMEGFEGQIIWAGTSASANFGGFHETIYNGIRDTVIDSQSIYVNFGSMRSIGAEAELRFRVREFEVFASGTLPFVQSKGFGEEWREMLFAPSWIAKSGLVFTKNPLTASVWGLFVGPRLDRENNEIGPQFRLNASLTIMSGSGLGFRMIVKNITNSPYEQPLYERFVPLVNKDRGRIFFLEAFWGR
ncbi:MAG: TonB-dependent receptor [candidate division WOR-3 bacterium]